MVKRVCGFCLGSVWEYPVQELPGCCEEDLQLGTNAPGSTEQFIYRYLLCYHKSSPTFVHIFNLAEMTNTPHVLHLSMARMKTYPRCSCDCLYRRQRPSWKQASWVASWLCSSSSTQRDRSLRRPHVVCTFPVFLFQLQTPGQQLHTNDHPKPRSP